MFDPGLESFLHIVVQLFRRGRESLLLRSNYNLGSCVCLCLCSDDSSSRRHGLVCDL